MKNTRIFEGYEDKLDKKMRDFFDLYSVRELRFKNSRTIAVFTGPTENEFTANPIIDEIKVQLDKTGEDILSDGETMSEFVISDYIYDHFETKLNSLGYSVDYNEEDPGF